MIRSVVGYVRLSRDADDSTSVARQREIIASTAAARGWGVVEIVEDVDVSATKRRLDRPGLARVRRMLADGEADAVLVWRLDRLARSVGDFSTLLDEGVNVVSATEPLDTTTPIGRAMTEIIAVFAALEARTIGERIRSAIDYRVRQGDRWRGGPTPYGYRSVPHASGDGRTLVVDADEAAHVRRAVDGILAGRSLYAVTQDLNAAGSRPRRAERWSLSSVRAVLTGDAILGRQTRHGEPVRDEAGVIVAPWEPIVTPEEAARLRALLAPRALPFRRRKATRVLSGLLVCASCGSRMRVNSRRSGSGTVETYGCRANADGRVCEAPAAIKADAVEAYVVDELLRVAGGMPVVERRPVARDAAGIAEIDEAIAHTTDLMRAPDADLGALVARLEALREDRAALAVRPREPEIVEVETGETFAERWARADLDERRALIGDMLGAPIEVRPVGRGHRVPPRERCVVPWPWEGDEVADV